MGENQIKMPTFETTLVPGIHIPMGSAGLWWRVLEVDWDSGTVLVMADEIICDKEYHESKKSITWEKCSLRAWLNGEYFRNAFTEEEQAAIAESHIQNPDNPEYHTPGGNDTVDRVFLLSLDEVKRFLINPQGKTSGDSWWLRSPGRHDKLAAKAYGEAYEVSGYGGEIRVARGVRPAFRINLCSDFFQAFILRKTESQIRLSIPQFVILNGRLISANPDCDYAKIILPEGITEIGARFFAGRNIQSVHLPSTLKKIGKAAFYDCVNLRTITCNSNTVSYGQGVFAFCYKLHYTPDLFHTSGKLCDSFAEHLDVCGPEELAWVLMYQKGERWEEALEKRLMQDTIPQVLFFMTEHIKGVKSPKKAAYEAVAFVRTCRPNLSGEEIEAFCDTLRTRKLGNLADELQGNSAISARPNQDRGEDARVLSNGCILFGRVETPIVLGIHITMGNEGTLWQVLSIDEEAGTALVIADQFVDFKAYHEQHASITWEKCTLRAWLNGEYFRNTFAMEEQAAITESHLSNPDNPKYHTPGGNDTMDRIFLLSIDEAQRFFISYLWDEWWLRSPGYNSKKAATACDDASDYVFGNDVWTPYLGVRPAFAINLKSDFFQSFIRKNEKGEEIYSSPLLVIRAGTVLAANPQAREVVLPSYVKKIGAGAFRNSQKLQSIAWAGTAPAIDKDAFDNCPNLRLPVSLFTGKKLPHEKFAEYLPEDLEALSNVMLLAGGKSGYLQKVIKVLNEGNAVAITDLLLKKMESLTVKNPEFLLRFAFASAPLLGEERLSALSDLLEKDGRLGSSWRKNLLREACRGGKKLDKEMFARPLFILQSKIPDSLPSISEITTAVCGYTRQYENEYVDKSDYKKGAKEYQRNSEEDSLAASMDHDALMALLKSWIREDGPRWYAPLAAFADGEKELPALLDELKAWEKDKKLREQIIRVRGAVLLNDSQAAMRYADSMGLLDRYAAMRGENPDDLRDMIVSDFGLDREGRKTWTLAGRSIIASVQDDLTLLLTDEDGKALKSVPKKGAAPEEYEAVSREYAALKKDIKTVAKARNEKIFSDFLSGAGRNGRAWEMAYLENPVLKALARLIVWEQGGKTFTIGSGGETCDVNEVPYHLKDTVVRVAHPMEMKKEETEAWQHYFADRKLKQPFEQVWEPVTDASLVKPGRYDGCTIPLYMLMNKDKHGIIMEGRSRITLKDCSADLEYIEGHRDWYNNEFEVRNFRFKKYTRQVNHIVVHLDKGTVTGRVKKDDITVAQWLDRFTLAQIMNFIEIANEAGAVNVKALLLEYKNTHFGGFDAMEEFTLDW